MEKIIAAIVVLILAFLNGYFVLAATISSASAGEWAVVIGIQTLSAVVIGILLPRFWYLSVMAAWAITWEIVDGVIHDPSAPFLIVGLFFLIGPVLALASGYLSHYVALTLRDRRSALRAQTLLQALTLAACALLIMGPGWLLYRINFPPPARRTENDLALFAIFLTVQLLVTYGGVLLGVGVYQTRKRKVGRSLRQSGVIEAGTIGVLALSLIVVVGVRFLLAPLDVRLQAVPWQMYPVLWFFFGLSEAVGLALLFNLVAVLIGRDDLIEY